MQSQAGGTRKGSSGRLTPGGESVCRHPLCVLTYASGKTEAAPFGKYCRCFLEFRRKEKHMARTRTRHEEAGRTLEPPPELLTVSEVAQRLRVDDTTVRRWIKSGALEAIL